MQSTLAKWANGPAQAPLWEAKPVRGEIGVLVVRETQEWDYLLNYERNEKPYPEAMWGAYRAFLDNGLQPDWVHIDDIEAYDLLGTSLAILSGIAPPAHARRAGSD